MWSDSVELLLLLLSDDNFIASLRSACSCTSCWVRLSTASNDSKVLLEVVLEDNFRTVDFFTTAEDFFIMLIDFGMETSVSVDGRLKFTSRDPIGCTEGLGVGIGGGGMDSDTNGGGALNTVVALVILLVVVVLVLGLERVRESSNWSNPIPPSL